MKKYLGSRMTAYAAVMCPLFVVAPLFFAIVALCSEISAATLFLAVFCCCCSGFFVVYMYKEALQLYAWGVFEESAIRVHCFLREDFTLDYEKCLGIGIEYYNHNAIHTNISSKVFFIYLSYDYYETKYRGRINLWKPNERRIKVQFDKNLYEYLLSVLPKKQAIMLQQDFRAVISEKMTGSGEKRR